MQLLKSIAKSFFAISAQTSISSSCSFFGRGFISLGQSKAGVEVNQLTAMQHATVLACYRVLSESIASLPLHVMQKEEDKNGKIIIKKAYNHPLYKILHDKPNRDMTAYNFIEAIMMNIVSRGSAYVQKIFNKKSEVIELYPLLTDRMRTVRSESGELGYIYYSDNYGEVFLEQNEIIAIIGLSLDGINGLSPIEYAANAIGLSIALEEFGSNFFKNGANPGAVFEIDSTLSDEAYERLKADLGKEYNSLKNSGKPMLLEEGLKFKQIGVPNNHSQFLETRKFQKSEIAAIFRIPPHLINDLEHATFTNIEQQSLEFATYTLTPWVKRIENAINNSLFLDTNYYCKFNMSAMVRGDINTRYDAYRKGIEAGFLTRNEVREMEHLNPIEGLDEPIIPLNMTTTTQTGEQNAKE